MSIPFTTEEFFNIFEQYNQAIFPLQVVFNLLALTCVGLVLIGHKYTNTVVAAILAFLWVWMGLVYHIIYFTDINKAAYLFGSLFIVQGILFFIFGVIRSQINFRPSTDIFTYLGGFFIFYALLLYPVIGYSQGHEYPNNPTFGLPCPTTIFTFGLLMLTDTRFPKHLLIIPALWSFVGFNAALSLDVSEDVMLLVAGVVTSAMIINRSHTLTTKMRVQTESSIP